MRNQHVQHRLLPPERWRDLAWLMLDEDGSVAGGFARKLAKAVRTARVHLKFLAVLSLAALEGSDDARREARCVLVGLRARLLGASLRACCASGRCGVWTMDRSTHTHTPRVYVYKPGWR